MGKIRIGVTKKDLEQMKDDHINLLTKWRDELQEENTRLRAELEEARGDLETINANAEWLQKHLADENFQLAWDCVEEIVNVSTAKHLADCEG